jgi:hypothetical protein
VDIVLIALVCWVVLSIAFGALSAWAASRFKRNTSRNARPHHLITRLRKWMNAA